MKFDDILDFINKNIAIITCSVTAIGLFLNNRNIKKRLRMISIKYIGSVSLRN